MLKSSIFELQNCNLHQKKANFFHYCQYNVQYCSLTSQALKCTARTHIASYYQSGFRTHIAPHKLQPHIASHALQIGICLRVFEQNQDLICMKINVLFSPFNNSFISIPKMDWSNAYQITDSYTYLKEICRFWPKSYYQNK